MMADALADVFIVFPCQAARDGGNGGARFGKELLREFVEADQRPAFPHRSRIDGEHVLHRRYEGGVLPGPDAPALLPPWLKFTFVRTVPTD